MAGHSLGKVVSKFLGTLAPHRGDDDFCLLDRFALFDDEEAFAVLLQRHGPMVWRTCQRLARQPADAEDAFQATFLVLCRKARSIGRRQSLGGWLHGVAYRIARKSNARTSCRPLDEAQPLSRDTDPATAASQSELRSLADEALRRLPAKYRVPLILCCLEGKTRARAAAELGWEEGTLSSRLARGKELLRAYLVRRNVTVSAAALATLLAQEGSARTVPWALTQSTLKVKALFLLGEAAGADGLAAKAVLLAEGVLQAMFLTKIKVATLVLLAATAVWLGSSVAIKAAISAPQSDVAEAKPAGQPALKTERAAPLPEKRAGADRKDKPLPANTPPVARTWPEGAVVEGRVVDHRGAPVANAEVLMLGAERIIVDADRRTWFVLDAEKDRPNPPSTRTDRNGVFRIERKRGTADRLAVIADDPLFWVVARKKLTRDNNIEIKLPPVGSIAIHCDLPGKPAKQPVMIQLQTFDGVTWDSDALRFLDRSFSVANPGERLFEHLPPGRYAVERWQQTPTGRNSVLGTAADRQVVKVESGKRADVRIERKLGRPLTGRVRGLENIDLRYAHVTIQYPGPEEECGPNGRRVRLFTAFDVIPITSEGRFTTDPIPPGKYHLHLFGVRSSTPEPASQSSDFDGLLQFTVPEKGDLPVIEVVAKPRRSAPRRVFPDYNRVRVVDEQGKPLPKVEAMIHTADAGYRRWEDGRDGIAYLGHLSLFREANTIDVLVRADGYAPTLASFAGDERNKLGEGEAVITMRRGQRVELRFRLPDGMTWPKGVLPETYFDELEDRARMMRQPVNRKEGLVDDFNLLNARPAGGGRFELHLAQETPRFHVAVHAPGFLQHFEAGPFTLADVKQGVLEIDVPRPASLETRFDPPANHADDIPFKGVSFQVLRQIQGSSYLQVATEHTNSVRHEFRLTDLAPGNYLVSVGTQPKAETKPVPGTGINPGSYRDQRKVLLRAGQSERVRFRYTPYDPNAFCGRRTAVLRVRMPDGTPAKGRKMTVEYYDDHFGYLVVFSGVVPASGSITLDGITDKGPSAWKERAYVVKVDDKQLGYFGFTRAEPTQEFEFQVAPAAGDMAPDVGLVRLSTNKPVRLSSLRGKIVCLEFWATWCGPCQPAMAKLNELSARRGASWKDRVALIPVSIDAARTRVQPHALRRGWSRLEHYGAGQGTEVEYDAPAARAFGVFGVPEAILIGPDGRILWRGHPLDKSAGQDLQSRIEDALAK